MSKQKKSNPSGGFVFSTNPDFQLREPAKPAKGPAPEQQTLRIWLERVKGGKEATVIKGFSGPAESLDDLARMLKSKCASGGNAKDGVVIIQGDHRDKILAMLLSLGYKNTKKAGG